MALDINALEKSVVDAIEKVIGDDNPDMITLAASRSLSESRDDRR